MRRLAFPWHKQIACAAHETGKYAILHSCGNYNAILENVIDDMRHDARHSYENTIVPAGTAYEVLRGCLGVRCGLDLNFMIPVTEKIKTRTRALAEKSIQ